MVGFPVLSSLPRLRWLLLCIVGWPSGLIVRSGPVAVVVGLGSFDSYYTFVGVVYFVGIVGVSPFDSFVLVFR